MVKMSRLARHIPNSMTLFNVAVGFAAILLAYSGEYEKSAALILVSVIVDSFDGYIARMLNSTSKFGGYMDTLSDFLSFGIAASVLMVNAFDVNWIFGLAFVLASGLRLLYFMRTKNSSYFFGVPTTVVGGLLATLVLLRTSLISFSEPTYVMTLVMVISSALMLTRKKYYRIELKKRKTVTLILAFFMSLFALNEVLFLWAVLLMFLGYIAFGWLRIKEQK